MTESAIPTPKIDKRDYRKVLEEIKELIPFYVPEWRASNDAGTALLHIFAHMVNDVIERLNMTPDKNFIAFLDMLGVKLKPAQPAKAAVTFYLSEGTPEDVLIPARTKIATKDNVVFETEKDMLATTAKLKAVYSVDPERDAIFDHTSEISEGARLFTGLQCQEHSLYLGHNSLFNLRKGVGKGYVVIRLQIELFSGTFRNVVWEYWGENEEGKEGWIKFDAEVERVKFDSKVKRDEEGIENGIVEIVTLRKRCPKPTKELEINGRKSFWIRAKASKLSDAPVIKSIKASIENEVGADAAFYNDVPIDLTNPFYPFGTRPKPHDTFYIASQECFSKKDATITIEFHLGGEVKPSEDTLLSWEYWDGKCWKMLKLKKGLSYKFERSSAVEFECPHDIEQVEVNGQKNYWIRVRIVEGNYGIQKFSSTGEPEPYEKCFHPPKIKNMKMSVCYEGNFENSHSFNPQADEREVPLHMTENIKLEASAATPFVLKDYAKRVDRVLKKGKDCQHLHYCFAKNNLQFSDYTKEARHGVFNPFQPLEDKNQAIYFGFDKPFSDGRISMFFSIEKGYSKDLKPRIEWSYFKDGKWMPLQVFDGTDSFAKSGTVEFVASDIEKCGMFGQELYWIKAEVTEGKFADFSSKPKTLPPAFPLLARNALAAPKMRVHLNTTWAVQAETIEDEILGKSDGTAKQTFSFSKSPVLDEVVWVQEPVLGDADADAVESIEDGKAWVRWHAVEDFLESDEKSRHYVIDRTSGTIEFGDGINGMIPPAGGIIKATYRSGGGAKGNVPAGEITNLLTSIAFVEKVSNPEPAQGGADTEKIEEVLKKAPKRIKHRNRAVTAEDYEWLAMDVMGVARAKCIPNLSDKAYEPGYVSVIVVPESSEDEPKPSPELIKRVGEYLKARCPANSNLIVAGPTYVRVSVKAEVYVASLDLASKVKFEAVKRLKQFLHPLYGYKGDGWEFGKMPCTSDIIALLEEIPGVDHVENVSITVKGDGLVVSDLPPYVLVSSGEHEIRIRWSGDYADSRT